MLSKSRVVVVLVLFALTWLGMRDALGVRPVPIKKHLSAFPKIIGDYRLADSFQSSADVVRMLGVNDYIQYNYVRKNGSWINLYVGYYDEVGVDGTYHSPRNCIPGGGWGIDNITHQNLDVGIDGHTTSTVAKMYIRRGDQYMVVLYWYQNRGRVIDSEYWEKIYQVIDALVKGRRDGTFVRIMAKVPGDNASLEHSDVKKFAEQVMTTLTDFLQGARL